ncbi:otogelin [Pelobates cultripes]|uniref:Otogelin n=1 Tax=Pelobates cultripes TaxID=61616 RepID=A0AAD1T7B7_PELCU|nr:otogelin [Pelobates cultripes]
MSILPVLVLTALCLFASVSSDKASCTFNGKTFKDGETILDNCEICECVDGEIKDCSVNANCKEMVTQQEEPNAAIDYEDDPNVIGSSNGNSSNRKKRDLLRHQEMKVNFPNVAQTKSSGGFEARAAMQSHGGLFSGGSQSSISQQGQVGFGVGGLHLGGSVQGGSSFSSRSSDSQANGNAAIGGLQVGGSLGHKSGISESHSGGANGGVEGRQNSLGLNGDVEIGGAKIELGGGAGHRHHELNTTWQVKKTISGGGESGELEGIKHALGLNGNVELGGAKIELGGGEGHGHREFSTSWEGKKTIIGGGVSGEIEGSKHGENVQVGGEAANLKVKDEASHQNEKHDFNSEEVTATFHGKVEGGWKKNWKEESSEERKDSFKSRKNFHGVNVQLSGEAASVELNGKFGHKNKKHEESGSNSKEETDKFSRKKGWKKTSESDEINSSENTEDSFNKEKRRGGGKQKFASSSEQSTITIKGKGKGGWKKFSESESSIEEEKGSFKKHKGTHVKGTFEEKTQHGHAYGHNNKGKTNKWGFKDGENESHDDSSEEKTIEDTDLEIEETGTVATPTEIPVTVYEPPVITEHVPLLYTENEVKPIVTEPEILPITRGPPIDCIFNKNSVADGESLVLNCVTCTCISGSLTCVKNLDCPGICSITGYQMVRTFDGTLYENPGTCSYVLVKTPSFSITLNNKPCVEFRHGIQDPQAVCIESVDIYIPLIASLSLSYDGTITSAGKQSAIPYFIHDTITILRSSSVFLDVASDFFNLQYDFKGNRLYVILQNSYKDQTSGLCGTYNDNRNDDYRSSLDITETVSGLFAVSWKTPGQCADKPKEAENEDKRVTAELTCTSTFQDSIFEDCRLLIDTHGYQASCANSIYYGNSEGFCSAVADYAYRCARAGIFIPVSSTFTFCTPTCQEDMILSSDNLFTQQDCAEYSATLLKISSSIPLNEACICPRDLYYDATLDRCVSGEQCPCYVNNDVYKLGQTITFPNGESCPCERILQCSGTDKPDNGGVIKECPENEIFSDCSLGYGTSCEPSCEFLAVLDQGCGAECTPGCICKHGLLRGSDGNCIPLNECPCIHGDDVYNPGETLASDCNTCTCENGKFSCTTNPCNKVCNAYAGSQFFLFDNIWKTYTTRDCPVVLVQSREDAVPNFRVIMQNVRSESVGGALARKYITIAFEGISVALTEGEPSVVYEPNSKAQVKIYRSGFYVVAHFTEGLTVYYDQHLDVIVQLEPSLQGKVLGMCGDADGSTTTELAISNMEQYASQYLLGECAEPEVPPFVPSDNHRSYVEKRCSVLKSSEFALCHTEVNVQPYYAACVEETESCREGESCLCFCTSLAAYARACCRKGFTIDWRNPDTCPSPCEYYNRAAGEGPYRLIMLNGNTLVTDFVSKKVYVIEDDLPNNLAATFMVTPSLYIDSLNGRTLVSLESAEHPNFFIVQNSDGSLNLQKWQPSVSFRSQATFIMRAGRWVRGYNALESFTSRGHYLSIKNDNSLIMSKVKSGNMLVMNFKLREENFGLPSFSICTWKYRACSNPCIPTCSDPLGTKCTLTLKVEGCYPICAPGMVFDEITHRCVRFEDCISFGVSTTAPPTTPPEPCKNVQCIVETCEQGETQVKVDSTDPCCPKYICVPEQTTTPSTSTLEPCKNVHCIVETCEQGETQVKVDSTDPCCPTYICVQTTTPSTSTLEPCKNVQCIVETCEQGENKVRIDSTDPCCPTYICVPVLTTTPSTTTLDVCRNVHCTAVTCNEGESLVKLDSADPCCALEVCVGTTTTTVPTTTEDKCKYVVCDVTVCYKSGSYMVQLPWSDPCCPRHECACKMCENPPICDNGEPPIAQFDENTMCCPVYSCEQKRTTTTVSSNTPNPCTYVECPTKTCNYGEYLVAISGTDPCCLDHKCIPEVTTPEPPISTITTPSPCENVQCPTSKCHFGDTVLVKVDSENPCCALYECVPPTTTPMPITTTQNICQDIVCPVHDCTMEGSSKIEIQSNDPCCKAYDCVCSPCSPAPFCNGNKPIMKIDPETQCCIQYECPVEKLPEKTTTPYIPTTTTEEPCKGIVCESVTCSRKGEVLVDLHVTGSCCPHVVCECSNVCPNPPVCEYGNTPIKHFNPEIECCPEYVCNPIEPTTPKVECNNVVCPTKTCDEEHTLVATLGNNPCCFDYTCVPHITTTTPHIVITTPTPEPCHDVVCPPPTTCDLGDTTLVKIDPANPCCNINECIVVPGTTTPHSTTTLDKCRDVACALPECPRDNSYPLSLGYIEPCCESYTCVCKPCGPPPSCDGYEKIFNSETQCCPTYICPVISTTTPIPTTTTENPCLNIVCEPLAQCSKKGETLVDLSWGNTCCRNIVCQCPTVCPDAPVCENGKPAIRKFNPEIECCPEYECQPDELTTPTPPLPCRDVVCPTKTCDENHILVAVKGDNLCCFDYICETIIPSTLPPTVTTPFIEPCHDVVCNTKHNCNPEDSILMKSDPENPCCSIYECIPPTTTTVPPTTTVDHCRDVTCSVTTCSRDGSYAQPTGGFYDCCPEYTCVCRPCASIPFCNGNKAIMNFDPFNECCPTYECPPPPPPPSPTPGLCSGVTCIKDVTCKFNEIEIHDVNPSDPCCPLYRCEPQITTPSVPTTTIVTSSICSNVKCYKDVQCRPGEPVIELPNPFDPCCPRYDCGTVTPTPTVIITTSQVDCSARVCERKVCGDSQRLVERVNPLDHCCPLYTCECECKTVPSCSSDERLVAVHQYNQCCPKLKCERKRDECHPVPTEVTLTSGQCSATVVLSSCSGYCYSKSDFDSLWNPIPKCRCCSATKTHEKNFELPCPNGSRARLTVLEAKECGCHKCSDNYEHSGSGSGSGSGEEGSGFLLWSNLEGRN